MQTYNNLLGKTFKVAGPVSARTFSDYTGAPCAAGAAALGVFRNDGVAGDLVAVRYVGTALVVSGGVIAAGAQVEVDAAAHAITHATGTVVGRAIAGATAAGQLVEILIINA